MVSERKFESVAKKYIKIFKDMNQRIMRRDRLVTEFSLRHGCSHIIANRYLRALEVYDNEDTANALFIRHGNSYATVEWTGRAYQPPITQPGDTPPLPPLSL